MNDISERVKIVRKNNNLTQKQFAERIFVTQSYLSRIESGKEIPNDKLIRLIALEFDVPTGWLEYGKGSQTIDDNSLDYYVRGNHEEQRKIVQETLHEFAEYLKELDNEVINGAVIAVILEMKEFLEATPHLPKGIQLNTFELISTVMLDLCVELQKLSPNIEKETFNSIAWSCSSHLTNVLLELKDIYFNSDICPYEYIE